MTPGELAERTGTAERYVREWLSAQAAAGYVRYDPEAKRFSLDPEQALVFADEDSPAFLGGFGDIVQAVFRDEPKITAAFKSGKGVGWHEHDPCLFCGTERFFRTSYKHHLVQEWLPALDGVEQKLMRGAKVADVGCGHGISTLLMAQAYPQVDLPRLRLSSGLDRGGAPARRRRRASPTIRSSRSPRPRPIRARATISSAASTACTTWATRSARRRMCARRWRRTAPS